MISAVLARLGAFACCRVTFIGTCGAGSLGLTGPVDSSLVFIP